MAEFERILLIAPPFMNRTPAFDRAASLAKAKSAALHIVAFDYVEGIANAGLVNPTAIEEMRATPGHAQPGAGSVQVGQSPAWLLGGGTPY